MNLLIIDPELALPFALKCQEAGHDVKHWIPRDRNGKRPPIGEGLVARPNEWEPYARWADLIVVTGNAKYGHDLEPYFRKGFPIIGANQRAAALELDRKVGMDFLTSCGIDVPPFEVFDSIDKAIAHIRLTGQTYVCKQWGGNDDKSMSYVSSSPAGMIRKLELWKRLGKVKGKFMLQKKIRGVEMGIGGWFGAGGFSEWKEENWEFKKLFNDDLGCNTGEMGTVMRYVRKSKLFDSVLAPCAERLHGIGYVGNIDVNCIIDEEGKPWPLEFTMRFGFPAINLNMALHEGDPLNWMTGLIDGRDLLQCKRDICVGVVMVHGDFPFSKFPLEEVEGFPISGLSAERRKNVWLTSVERKPALVMSKGEMVERATICTAGDYVCVTTGLGSTVEAAREAVYDTTWKVKWDSNVSFRTDIGCRLEKQLPLLQVHGYAERMRYA